VAERANCAPETTVAVAGASDIVTGGTTVSTAVAVFVLSACAAAVTVTVVARVRPEGAVYRPVLPIVPTFGLRLH
jgi:hypothetical protein